jgi:hypothetical protein
MPTAGVSPSADLFIEAGQAIGKSVLNGESPLRADIPSEVGGTVDVIYDTAYEQPDSAEDRIDLPGPSVGDVADPDNPDGDSVRTLVGAVLAGGVLIAVIVAVGQLVTFNVGVGN